MDSYLSNSKNNLFPLVTVAVITRNRADSLKKTLDSFSQLDYPKFEVIVVDNASTDHTKEIITQSGYQYLFSPKNNGFAKTRQIAVDAAKGEFICWCDDDCIPGEDWINQFIKIFNQDKTIALIGGRVINHGFKKELANKGISKHWINGRCKFVENVEEAEFFGNLNMVVRKSAVISIGGYDPFFKGGYEEIDLNLTLRRFGFKIKYAENAIVDHFHNETTYKKGRFFYGASMMRLYLYLKHFHVLKNHSFIKNELIFFWNDFYYSVKGLGAGLFGKRKTLIKLSFVELFNGFFSRISIPWLILKSIFYNKRLETLKNKV